MPSSGNSQTTKFNWLIDAMSLQTDDSGRLVLEGELTFDTVAEIYRQSGHLLSAGDRFRAVELSKVKRVDSAGLALLLEWQSSARSAGRLLRFENPPPGLVRLAALCDADKLLGFEEMQRNDDDQALRQG
jgi:phospholipid transport system transporter-binding protein